MAWLTTANPVAMGIGTQANHQCPWQAAVADKERLECELKESEEAALQCRAELQANTCTHADVPIHEHTLAIARVLAHAYTYTQAAVSEREQLEHELKRVEDAAKSSESTEVSLATRACPKAPRSLSQPGRAPRHQGLANHTSIHMYVHMSIHMSICRRMQGQLKRNANWRCSRTATAIPSV